MGTRTTRTRSRGTVALSTSRSRPASTPGRRSSRPRRKPAAHDDERWSRRPARRSRPASDEGWREAMSSTEARDQAAGGRATESARRAPADGHAGGPGPRRRRWLVLGVLVVLLAAGLGAAAAAGASSSGSAASGSAASGSSSGTFTWLPAVGATVRQGQVIYRVSGSPAVLLYGNVPAYRDLSEGLPGDDVTELNADLVKLGY